MNQHKLPLAVIAYIIACLAVGIPVDINWHVNNPFLSPQLEQILSTLFVIMVLPGCWYIFIHSKESKIIKLGAILFALYSIYTIMLSIGNLLGVINNGI